MSHSSPEEGHRRALPNGNALRVSLAVTAGLAGAGLLVAATLVWMSARLHTLVLLGDASSWTVGFCALFAAELLAAASFLLRRGLRRRAVSRTLLAGAGIVLCVVTGTTFVAGRVGDVATFTLASAACHGGPDVVAKETGSLLESEGALYSHRGIFLVEVPGSEYSPGPIDEPVAEGEFTATCEADGTITVTFPTSSYGPSIAPIIIRP